jgi:glycosyltransferase involved in cell wall biosynthesis
MIDAIAAIGDAGDLRCWSGIPFHCLQGARRLGWNTQPWRLDMSAFAWPRRAWNLGQLLRLRGIGGYQTSQAFLDKAERPFLPGVRGRLILSFHHQFPRAASVRGAGGRIIYYLDATLAAMLDGYALDLRLPRATAALALAIERENLARADHVFTMSRWLRDYLVERKLVGADRLSVVLPGANLDLPAGWRPGDSPMVAPVGATMNRPDGALTLGLVGNDYERKGLPFLIEVARSLKKMGVNARIRVIGRCPKDIDPATTDVLGPIDKGSALDAFLAAISTCDIGCLFSAKEAFGISVLEFLRAGIPVAGFDHEGPADSIPPDAGFRFRLGAGAVEVAAALRDYAFDGPRRDRFREAARAWSGRLRWERSLGEIAAIVQTGASPAPVQPWNAINPSPVP